MRSKVVLVWLEDTPNGAYTEKKNIVRKKIESKGYDVEFVEFTNLTEAKAFIENPNQRVDFFISDYNLGDDLGTDDTGLDYLVSLRYNQRYKEFFILYSKKTEKELQSDIIERIQKDGLAILSNFMCISTADYPGDELKEEFCKAIDISLSRWDELNAVRGMYMYENAEIEHLLRKYFKDEYSDEVTYNKLVNSFKAKKVGKSRRDSEFFRKWFELIKERNALAHTEELFDDNGYYISGEYKNGDIFNIYENELDEKRKHLLDTAECIKRYIKK